MTGTIKTLVSDKYFGFITADPEEGLEKDIFFHSNSLVDVMFGDLKQGNKVSFETEMSPKGMNAVNVKKTSDA